MAFKLAGWGLPSKLQLTFYSISFKLIFNCNCNLRDCDQSFKTAVKVVILLILFRIAMKLQISEKPPQLLHIKTVGQRCNPALVRISIYLWPSEPLLCLLKEGTCLTKVALRFETSLPPLEKVVNLNTIALLGQLPGCLMGVKC